MEALQEARATLVECGGPDSDVAAAALDAARRLDGAARLDLVCRHSGSAACLELEDALRYLAGRKRLAFEARREAPAARPVFLVTGALGQIGRAMTRLLDERGHERLTLDLAPSEDPRHLRCDLSRPDAAALAAFCRPVTHVIHLASRITRDKELDGEYAEQRALNVGGAEALLRALPAGARHFAFASTMTVYGDAGLEPVDEARPESPNCVYALCKLAAERRLREEAPRRGVRAAILRYASVYGPGPAPGRAIPAMIARLAAGRPPEIRGAGTTVRDYVHVDDVCRATLAASLKEADGVYNVGSGAGTSTAELARTLVRISGLPLEAAVVDADADEQAASSLVFDVSKARRELGWEPRTALEDGLRDLYRRAKEER